MPGGAWAWFFEAGCELVGMDRFFYLMADKPDVAHRILERTTSFMEKTSEIMFEKAGKHIDICFTGDTPAGMPYPDVLGKGPVLKLQDSMALMHPAMTRWLKQVAHERGIPYQVQVQGEHGGTDEGPAAEAAVADDAQRVAEPATPEFLREVDTDRKRRRTGLFGTGALLLAVVLLAQLTAAFRAEILVTFPQARPALAALCKVFRCTVGWPARGELLAVVGSELQALPGTGAFELTAVVRNRGNITLALPAIELTLSDTLNRTVARRVFSPSDYLAAESDPQARLLAGLEAGADLTVKIAFEARELNAAGFVVYPFYL